MSKNEADILSQIYTAITTAPEILTPPFVEGLLTEVLPLAESGADNDTVENSINLLYRQFKDVRDKIKALKRKNLDDKKSKIIPGYDTPTNTSPDIDKELKRLEEKLKQRIDKNSITPASDAKN
jgi:chaperonin cofactor prefoldin